MRFDGVDSRTGEKRYKGVSALQDQAERKMRAIPRSAAGSHIDFQLSPTITAFGAIGASNKKSINSDGLLDLLSVDFARALKDLAALMNDMKKLSTLGDLPIVLHDRSTIRVQFPGCDAETVERLCDEVGVQRGRITQDEDFALRTGADLALLFPFAPSVAPSSDTDYFFEEASQPKPHDLDWPGMISPQISNPFTSKSGQDSGNAISFDDGELYGDNPWNSSLSDYTSINVSELGDRAFFWETSSAGQLNDTSEYDGVEGIYRFLAQCDRARH